MGRRLDLHELLKTKAANVYFQPPPSIQMAYPCIVYNRDDDHTDYADDNPYRSMQRYNLQVISQDADDPLVEEIKKLPMCKYQRWFPSDDLNHDNFSLYY